MRGWVGHGRCTGGASSLESRLIEKDDLQTGGILLGRRQMMVYSLHYICNQNRIPEIPHTLISLLAAVLSIVNSPFRT